jgi:hypothetical protein
VAKRNRPVIWFERKDYDAIKRLMPDEPYLCDTFEQWLEKANKEIKKLEALGFVVRKAVIQHEQFAAYCAQTGQDCNATMLGAFAGVVDRRNYERGE